MDASDKAYVIEANANPQLAQEEDFAQSAKRAKMSYPRLLERIMALGLQWQPHRMGLNRPARLRGSRVRRCGAVRCGSAEVQGVRTHQRACRAAPAPRRDALALRCAPGTSSDFVDHDTSHVERDIKTARANGRVSGAQGDVVDAGLVRAPPVVPERPGAMACAEPGI